MTATWRVLLLAGLCLGLALTGPGPAAFGQQNQSEIAGIVSGANGQAVSGASVTAKNDATGQIRKATTAVDGSYGILGIEPGPWTVTVEGSGMKTAVYKAIEVETAQRSVVNASLESGGGTVESVLRTPALESASAAVGTDFAAALLANVPVFVRGDLRNGEIFATWAPGVVNGLVDTNIVGGLRRGKDVLIDGSSATGSGTVGVVAPFPTGGQLSEVRVLTNSLSAEYGRTSGGVEVWTARRGTNYVHGSVFDYLRNDALDAAGWAVNSSGGHKPKLREDEYGFQLGGPVVIPEVYDGRNKSFFNVSLNSYKQNATDISQLVTIPTLAERNGDFSRLLNSAGQRILIYDPASEADHGSGLTRTVFDGNVIPASRLSSVSKAIMSYLPTPDNIGLTNNYVGHDVEALTRYAWGARGDQMIGPNRRISAFATIQRNDTNATGPLPNELSAGNRQYGHYEMYRLSYQTTGQPDSTNQLTFGYTRAHNYWDRQADQTFNWSQLLGLTGVDNGGASSFPVVNFGGSSLLPLGRASDLETVGGQYDRTMNFTDVMTKVRGRHVMKAGFDFRLGRNFQNPVIQSGAQGVFNFSNVQTAQVNAISTTGFSLASFVLGQVDSASRVYASLGPDYRTIYGAGFIQDHMYVNSRLSVDIGLRYDIPGNVYDNNNTLSSFAPNVANPAVGGIPGAIVIAGTGQGHTGQKRFGALDKVEFAPRLGLAYRVGDRTVVRAGYAMLYSNGNGLTAAGCALCNIGGTSVVQQTSNGLDAAFLWDQGLLPQSSFRQPPQVGPSIGNGGPAIYIDPNNGKAPRFENYSVNIQHQAPMGVLLDVGFLGNHGTRESGPQPLNELSPNYLSLGSLLAQQINSPAVVARGYKLPYAGFTGTLAQALRPYPQFGNITDPYAANLHSDYKALVVKAQKRTGDLAMEVNYTYSRATTDGAASVALTNLLAPQNQYSAGNVNSRQVDDIPNVFNLLLSWDIPVGKGKRFMSSSNGIVNGLIGGWSLATQETYRSGTLLLITAPNTLGSGVLFAPNTLPNATGGAVRTGTDAGSLDPNNPTSRWLNPAAFSVAAPFTLGNGAQLYGGARNPMLLVENFSAVKRTYLRESLNVEYRVDVFNLFNRNEFGNINSNVGDPNFGRPTGTQLAPRFIQMALKFGF